jgi:hypothetical protein
MRHFWRLVRRRAGARSSGTPHSGSTNPPAAMVGNATSQQRFYIDNVTRFIAQTGTSNGLRVVSDSALGAH